ncbi:hypothetical protein AB0A81_30565 [Streptomyces flaveolus]|uniref:Uncharacterized protein n=1 Tax=Streptomyces flaveolus TaxID=67297 RepID=A0ABV1VPN2_9ACTN
MQWRSQLFEIPRSAVVRLLVMLATDAMEVSRQHDFPDRRPHMEQHAQVILSRFPQGSQSSQTPATAATFPTSTNGLPAAGR